MIDLTDDELRHLAKINDESLAFMETMIKKGVVPLSDIIPDITVAGRLRGRAPRCDFEHGAMGRMEA